MHRLSIAIIAALSTIAVTQIASAAPPAAMPYSWTGFYVGGNIGYSWGDASGNISDSGFGGFLLPTSFSASLKPDGVIGGGQVGYNWQANNTWVFGLEADFQGSAERASTSLSNPFGINPYLGTLTQNIEAKILWFGTLRGRVGVLATPTLLLYATGGLAYGETDVSAAGIFTGFFPGGYSFNSSHTNVGWTLGGGIEGAIPNTSNWTWKLEYLYIDLGSQSGAGTETAFGTNYTWNVKFTDNILRIGVNYKFQ